LFRSTSEIQKRQSRRRRLLVRRSISGNGSLAFAYSPDSFIDAGEVIKAGNTTTVARVRLDGRDCLVKRYNIKNFLHGLKRLVTPSRASKSWRAGLILEMLGVETARPLLALECRSLWLLRRESYILCEFVAGPTVWELLGRDDVDDEAAEKVFRGFQRLLDTMRQYRISHGDMKATNFIFRGDRLVVVDLDAMARHASVASFRPAFRKDLDRFRKNFSGDSPLHRFASRAERLVGEFHD
jgi:tRNA A-37 threonylcarbamoyl transferase component Bud32